MQGIARRLLSMGVPLAAMAVALPQAAVAQDAPRAGQSVEFQGQTYTVLAAGTEEMEAVSSGESIVIVIDMEQPVATLVRDAGVALRLDPQQPMLWLDGEPYSVFVDNAAYMQRNAAGKPFAILEYDRAAN